MMIWFLSLNPIDQAMINGRAKANESNHPEISYKTVPPGKPADCLKKMSYMKKILLLFIIIVGIKNCLAQKHINNSIYNGTYQCCNLYHGKKVYNRMRLFFLNDSCFIYSYKENVKLDENDSSFYFNGPSELFQIGMGKLMNTASCKGWYTIEDYTSFGDNIDNNGKLKIPNKLSFKDVCTSNIWTMNFNEINYKFSKIIFHQDSFIVNGLGSPGRNFGIGTYKKIDQKQLKLSLFPNLMLTDENGEKKYNEARISHSITPTLIPLPNDMLSKAYRNNMMLHEKDIVYIISEYINSVLVVKYNNRKQIETFGWIPIKDVYL